MRARRNRRAIRGKCTRLDCKRSGSFTEAIGRLAQGSSVRSSPALEKAVEIKLERRSDMSDQTPKRNSGDSDSQAGEALHEDGRAHDGADGLRDSDDTRHVDGVQDGESEPNYLALGLGLLVILTLLLGTWFIVAQMSCNPLYSDAALAHSKACR
jgi:hypothetical protein